MVVSQAVYPIGSAERWHVVCPCPCTVARDWTETVQSTALAASISRSGYPDTNTEDMRKDPLGWRGFLYVGEATKGWIMLCVAKKGMEMITF